MNWCRWGDRALAPRCRDRETYAVTNTDSSHHPGFFRSVIRWLQVGYPQGVPGPDQIPLLALLRSTPLTPEQLQEVVHKLTADGSEAVADGKIDGNEIAEKISELTHHDAGPENVRRGAATLAAAGWPLAGIDVSELVPGDEDGEAAEETARHRIISS
jgi:uncharacterized protein DUF3349